MWQVQSSYAVSDDPLRTDITGCIASAETRARITCMAVTGGQQQLVAVHIPEAPISDEPAVKPTKSAIKRAKLKAKEADKEDSDDEGAKKKLLEAPTFKIVKAKATNKVQLAPEAPKGSEEDDHSTLVTMLQKSKKTVKREQRKRMFAIKKKAAREAAHLS